MPPELDIFTPWVDCGEVMTRRERNDLSAPWREESVSADQKRICLLSGGRGEGWLEDLKTLLHKLVRVHAHASGFTAGVGEGLDEPGLDGIKTGDKKYRNGLGGGLRVYCRYQASARNDQLHLTTNQIGQQLR